MNLVPHSQRLSDIQRFYAILDARKKKVGGVGILRTAHGRMSWPKRGVYFFFESGEMRTTSGKGLRVVRIGTHALIPEAKTTLWDRLRAHKGTIAGKWPGGGNHRASVFRLHVGKALLNRDSWPDEIRNTWGVGNNAGREIIDREYPLEKAVSAHIREMPFLWIEVDDEPGPNNKRAYIEKNTIALLSNYLSSVNPIDLPSMDWLGNHSPTQSIRRSGLWNVNFVGDAYDPGFLSDLEHLI